MRRYKQSLRLRARRAEREAEALASEMHWLYLMAGRAMWSRRSAATLANRVRAVAGRALSVYLRGEHEGGV